VREELRNPVGSEQAERQGRSHRDDAVGLVAHLVGDREVAKRTDEKLADLSDRFGEVDAADPREGTVDPDYLIVRFDDFVADPDALRTAGIATIDCCRLLAGTACLLSKGPPI